MKKALAIVATLIVGAAVVGPTHVSAAKLSAKPSMTLTAHLSGKNEVGAAGPKSGSGMATIRIYMPSHRQCYTLSVAGFKLPALAAHIHAGKAGKNGPVLVPFPTAPGKTGKATGCVSVKSSVLTAISHHPSSYYVNVHTATYPGGAVRGQLM